MALSPFSLLAYALQPFDNRIRHADILPQDKDLIATLAQFKHLRSLVTWNVIGRETSNAVAQACPSLQLIACLHYSYSHEYVILPVNPFGTPRPLHDPEHLLWKDA